ncbi:chaoptin [Bacillus rossius redtenbacheri]|uniref:chaoptin n=1 Tax=Bacillus rossius redtenbacheri TaxID=93214 RepID=UPI002FDCD036
MGIGAVMKMGYALVVVSVLLMVWVSLAHGREVEQVQYPPCVFNPLCSCSKAVPDLGIVVCQDVPLARIPPQLNSSKIFMLHLENNNLRSIEPYFLQATGLYRLEISHNPVPDIPAEAFVGLERSLWELELQHNQLQAVPSRAFRHLQKLRRLDLTGNKISEISADSWRGLEGSLQTLVLAHNALSSLPAEAFSALPSLESLDLTGNDLSGLDPATFHSGPPRLSRLLLADNQLPWVPYRQVAPLRALRTLDLSYNMVTNLHSASSEPDQPGTRLSLDTLRLDYNQIQHLPPGAFQHFDLLNRTSLDGNPIFMIEADAFRDARIRELSLRDCGVTVLSPGAFGGLEASLQQLDLYGNNLTALPHALFREFDFLKTLSLGENHLPDGALPGDSLSGFQYSLYRLDVSGRDMGVASLQDLRRIRNLRAITLSKLPQTQLSPQDFEDFGLDLEEIKITHGNLRTIKNHAFKHVRGLKRLDLSEGSVSQIESEAFAEVGHSLAFLRMAHGLSSAMSAVPSEALRPLGNLQHLDLSNNRLRSMPETSFHFLRRLKVLELQDNQIETVFKGTFQGGIHSSLEKLYLSFNNLQTINTHTFVDLTSLERLYLDDNRIGRVERRAFMNMDRLKHLDLRGNKIRTISDEAFQNLPELQTLDLAYNELAGFDFAAMDQVGVLASFRVNVSHNRIQKLEVNASSLSGRDGSGFFHSNVKVLDLSFNNISWFGRGYLQPVEASVTQLYLGHNHLQNATRDVFGNMPHLQWLDLSHNRLSEMDFDSFRNTRRLQVVRLDHNLLADVPAELFRGLAGLRVSELAHNRLRALPDGLFPEEGLERLDASHNQLARVPASCLGASAASLVELDLSHNLIASLQGAEMFGKFRSLSWLDLSGNRLARVEDGSFAALRRLSHLELSHNQGMVFENRGRSFRGLEHSLLHLGVSNCSLAAVPELPLPSLWSLDVSRNELAEAPLDMTLNLTALRRLDLSRNQLGAVPMAAQSLPQLRELSLAANPITALTNATMMGGAQRLRALDIRQLPLHFFETGALCKMTSLRTIELSSFKSVRHFNIPQVIQSNTGLRNLHIESHEAPGLQDEMKGWLPYKVRNITFSGQELRNIPEDALQGVRSPRLHVALRNSSVESLRRSVFRRMGPVRNVTLDVRGNRLRALGNPSTGGLPGLPRAAFLAELRVAGNAWSCDCELGWVEMWQRKKRQYLCADRDRDACLQKDDDLRLAVCANKHNASLVEVLKTDVECGWGSGTTVAAGSPRLLLALTVAALAALL